MKVICIYNKPWKAGFNDEAPVLPGPKFGEVCEVMESQPASNFPSYLYYKINGYSGWFMAEAFLKLPECNKSNLMQKLALIEPTTLMGMSIHKAVSNGKIDDVAQMIFDWSCDNLKTTVEVIGYDTLNEVINYLIYERNN